VPAKSAGGKAALGKQILHVAITQRETKIEPDRVLDDRRRKAMSAMREMGHARTLSDQFLPGDPVAVTMRRRPSQNNWGNEVRAPPRKSPRPTAGSSAPPIGDRSSHRRLCPPAGRRADRIARRLQHDTLRRDHRRGGASWIAAYRHAGLSPGRGADGLRVRRGRAARSRGRSMDGYAQQNTSATLAGVPPLAW
jgi:hypothetical protein